MKYKVLFGFKVFQWKMSDLLRKHKQHKTEELDSANDPITFVSFTKLKTFTARSFSIIGSLWWDQLPVDLNSANNELFKERFKLFVLTFL